MFHSILAHQSIWLLVSEVSANYYCGLSMHQHAKHAKHTLCSMPHNGFLLHTQKPRCVQSPICADISLTLQHESIIVHGAQRTTHTDPVQ